ncbi:MAG: glutaminyl-peptide cyclotransferase [Muribaculaceae bacterium]|nr:glutaminyl-peptide cyclotransferase [Muribaculaceae bacterium]
MRKIFFSVAAAIVAAPLLTAVLSSCSKSDSPDEPIGGIIPKPIGEDGILFVINEGNFQYSNSSLSLYNPTVNEAVNEIFIKANGMKLGDVAQSMTIADGKGWIIVNNSNVVFAVDPETLKEKGRITGLTSPRFFHLVNDTKAYITQQYDNRIAIVNPKTYSITGYIDVPGMEVSSGSTEQMVSYGDYVYCNCWSYQKSIIRIDPKTDKVVASLEVGIQPKTLAVDKYGKLWTMTDGGWDGNPLGHEAPELIKIDAKTFTIEKKFAFNLDDYCSKMTINAAGDRLYWIKNDVWTMDVTATDLPTAPIVKTDGTWYYGLTVAPSSGDVYVADAIDYKQNGRILRYSAAGDFIGQFSVGVNPSSFCWYRPTISIKQ